MEQYKEFYDEGDLSSYPPKPKFEQSPKGMVSISLNFIFYILIYLFLFQGDLKLLAAILMVMFVHEFGHFVWMKKYNYVERNLFFIPFMNYFLPDSEGNQISLREKLILVFFGPFPGLLLGFTAIWLGDYKGNSDLSNLGWIFMVWNLMNLLPLDSLDGGVLSSVLFKSNEYLVKLITSIVITVFLLGYIWLSQSFITILIPVFLFLRLNALKKLYRLRYELESKGIDWQIHYDELNNKQYWMIRKEMGGAESQHQNMEMLNEISGNFMERMMSQQIKSVLQNPPYDDLSKRGKFLAISLWILLFAIPLTFLFLFAKA